MSIYELVAWDQKTIEIYEQTKKHTNRPKSIRTDQKASVTKELIKISLPCYNLLNGFYLKSLLFNF